MSYLSYKLIHFLGICTMLVALAATSMHALRGGTRADNPHRRVLGAAHGIAAFLILLGGFGMLARLGIVSGGLPNWIIAKLVIWFTLAASIVIPYRSRAWARVLLLALPLLAVSAGAIALLKPF